MNSKWIHIPQINEYYTVNHVKIGPRIQYCLITVVWEYSKNNWVCADVSTLTGTMKNMRGFFDNPQDIMDHEDFVDQVVSDIINDLDE